MQESGGEVDEVIFKTPAGTLDRVEEVRGLQIETS
jgi:hypothetical protein